MLVFDIAEMWKCSKLLRFSIQTTEKLFMPNVTIDSNIQYSFRCVRVTAGRPEVGLYFVRSARSYKHPSKTIMNKLNVI